MNSFRTGRVCVCVCLLIDFLSTPVKRSVPLKTLSLYDSVNGQAGFEGARVPVSDVLERQGLLRGIGIKTYSAISNDTYRGRR